MSDQHPETAENAIVRPARAADTNAILDLFSEGLEEGTAGAPEAHSDLVRLDEAYLSDDGESGFWVAEVEDQLVGMVGVQVSDPHTAEIRRLRVAEHFRRRGIGARLLQQAVDHCREHGLLKVSLDVLVDRKPAIELFEKKGFRLNRERQIDDRILLDFYIDLYRERPS